MRSSFPTSEEFICFRPFGPQREGNGVGSVWGYNGSSLQSDLAKRKLVLLNKPWPMRVTGREKPLKFY